jgi:hypothetical protein
MRSEMDLIDETLILGTCALWIMSLAEKCRWMLIQRDSWHPVTLFVCKGRLKCSSIVLRSSALVDALIIGLGAGAALSNTRAGITLWAAFAIGALFAYSAVGIRFLAHHGRGSDAIGTTCRCFGWKVLEARTIRSLVARNAALVLVIGFAVSSSFGS